MISGVYGHLRRWMVALERNERKYLGETKNEISAFRNQGNSVTGKQARDWVNKIVKSFWHGRWNLGVGLFVF